MNKSVTFSRWVLCETHYCTLVVRLCVRRLRVAYVRCVRVQMLMLTELNIDDCRAKVAGARAVAHALDLMGRRDGHVAVVTSGGSGGTSSSSSSSAVSGNRGSSGSGTAGTGAGVVAAKRGLRRMNVAHNDVKSEGAELIAEALKGWVQKRPARERQTQNAERKTPNVK